MHSTMDPPLEGVERGVVAWAARAVTAVALALGVMTVWFTSPDEPLPAAALGSAWVLRVESGAIVATLVWVVGVVVVRSGLQGRLPRSIGRGSVDFGPVEQHAVEKETESG